MAEGSSDPRNQTADTAKAAAASSATDAMRPGGTQSSGAAAAAAAASQTTAAGADREARPEKPDDQQMAGGLIGVADEAIFAAGTAASLRGDDDDLIRGRSDDLGSDDGGDIIGWGVLPVSDLVNADALSLEQFHDGLYHDLSDITEGLDDDFYASLAAL